MRKLKKSLWPVGVNIKLDQSHVNPHHYIEVWLEENIGAFKDRWNSVPRHDSVDYYFKNTKDSNWFLLRWS